MARREEIGNQMVEDIVASGVSADRIQFYAGDVTDFHRLAEVIHETHARF